LDNPHEEWAKGEINCTKPKNVCTKPTDQIYYSKAISRSASQEISRLIRNPVVHYSVHNTKSSVHILTDISEIQTLKTYFHDIF